MVGRDNPSCDPIWGRVARPLSTKVLNTACALAVRPDPDDEEKKFDKTGSICSAN